MLFRSDGNSGRILGLLPQLTLAGDVPTVAQGSAAETGGVETVTLTVPQIASHSHPMLASNDIPTGLSPQGTVTGEAANKIYRLGNPTVFLNPNSMSPTGGSQPHNNFQPYLCVDFIISLFGIFPSQT